MLQFLFKLFGMIPLEGGVADWRSTFAFVSPFYRVKSRSEHLYGRLAKVFNHLCFLVGLKQRAH